MDAPRIGASFRVIRHRLGLRQADVAARAGLSQQTISLVERGGLHGVSIPTIDTIAGALGARIDLIVRWRGADLDRILDAVHAALVGETIRRLRSLGWEAHAEVSYSEFGERGSIDVLAIDPARRAVVVVEVKSQLASLEGTLRKHDEKIRLASPIARTRFGFRPATIVGLLVLPGSMTARRQVDRHEPVLRGAYPLRGRAAWGILEAGGMPGTQREAQASPRASAQTSALAVFRGLVFLSDTRQAGAGSARTTSRIALPRGPRTSRA